MFNRIVNKPLRTVSRWQLYATVVISVAAGWMAGVHGAVSAVLGGFANQTADLVFVWLASNRQLLSAGKAFHALIRAEAARIALIVLMLLAVLTVYEAVVYPAFFLSFMVSILIFRLAILVKE